MNNQPFNPNFAFWQRYFAALLQQLSGKN